MKNRLLLIAVMAIGLGAKAQTSTGFHLTPTISAVDFREKPPLNTYLGTTAKQNLNFGLEAGYFGEVFGVAATVQTDFDFDSAALLGVKGYANMFSVENVVFKGELGAATFVKDQPGSQWQYKAAVSGNIPVYKNFDVKLAAQASTFGDDNFKRYYPGFLAGISYKL